MQRNKRYPRDKKRKHSKYQEHLSQALLPANLHPQRPRRHRPKHHFHHPSLEAHLIKE